MIKLKTLLPECNECGRDWNHGHDHESGMAKNELRDMISNASKIDQMVGEGDNLPGWVSAYISLAADYMHSVAEYLAGETSRMQQPGPGYSMTEAAEERTFTYKDATGREKYLVAANPDEAKLKVQKFGGDVNSVKEKSAPLPIRPKFEGKKGQSRAQQAAIAISLQNAGKKPK
jgi:hypothetical protein